MIEWSLFFQIIILITWAAMCIDIVAHKERGKK